MKSAPIARLMDVTTLVAKWTGNERIELQTIQTLLAICLSDSELPQKALEKALGLGQSSVSRNVAKLGIGMSPDDPGPGLVETYEDPYHRSRKLVRLTDKGRSFCDVLINLMTGVT